MRKLPFIERLGLILKEADDISAELSKKTKKVKKNKKDDYAAAKGDAPTTDNLRAPMGTIQHGNKYYKVGGANLTGRSRIPDSNEPDARTVGLTKTHASRDLLGPEGPVGKIDDTGKVDITGTGFDLPTSSFGEGSPRIGYMVTWLDPKDRKTSIRMNKMFDFPDDMYDEKPLELSPQDKARLVYKLMAVPETNKKAYADASEALQKMEAGVRTPFLVDLMVKERAEKFAEILTKHGRLNVKVAPRTEKTQEIQ